MKCHHQWYFMALSFSEKELFHNLDQISNLTIFQLISFDLCHPLAGKNSGLLSRLAEELKIIVIGKLLYL
jgi:hypothetical protein